MSKTKVERDLEAEKISELTQEYGFESAEDLVAEYLFDSSMPAICKNMNCHAVYEYEHDQDRGWCDECETNSVASMAILLGII